MRCLHPFPKASNARATQPPAAAITADAIVTVSRLAQVIRRECLSSLSQNYDFVYQNDGTAVVYQRDGAHDAKPVWASSTYAPGKAGKVVMQDDGNFVVYDVNGAAVAASASNGTGRRIVLEDDGRLVIYDEQGNAQWDSQKSQMRKA